MRHLVVCCDGTWQDVARQAPVKESNVARLRAALVLPDDDPPPHYVRGVGSSGSPVDRIRGGAVGAGLTSSVTDGYEWLVRRYRPGDRISIFGFSRGAYTARSLAGMIGRVGLVDGSGPGVEAAVRLAYAAYRHREPLTGVPMARRPDDDEFPIAFVGVWDTVGSLGIPAYVGLPDLHHSRERYQFLDVTLNPRVPHARHAVSLDEMRGPFRPTLWRDVPAGQDVKQVWFPGDHCDVGGGHDEKGLSDGALDWMMTEAEEAVGLRFDRDRLTGFAPDPTGRIHGRPLGARGLAEEIAYQPRPRTVPLLDADRPDLDVHSSVYARQAARADYRHTVVLRRSGDIGAVTVPAREVWTAAGLWLEPGRYRVKAAGRWASAGDACGPEGECRAGPPSGREFTALADAVQAALRRLVANPEATLPGSRRDPGRPWMALIGVIANERTDVHGAIVTRDQHAVLADGSVLDVEVGGYLHAHANDAWGFHGNNAGSIELTIVRE